MTVSFEIKGRTRLRAPTAEDTFSFISSMCLHQVSSGDLWYNTLGFGMSNFLDDSIVNFYFNVIVLDG